MKRTVLAMAAGLMEVAMKCTEPQIGCSTKLRVRKVVRKGISRREGAKPMDRRIDCTFWALLVLIAGVVVGKGDPLEATARVTAAQDDEHIWCSVSVSDDPNQPDDVYFTGIFEGDYSYSTQGYENEFMDVVEYRYNASRRNMYGSGCLFERDYGSAVRERRRHMIRARDWIGRGENNVIDVGWTPSRP